MTATPGPSRSRLAAVELDATTLARLTPDMAHEQEVAVYDLLQANSFAPVGHDGGPWTLKLSLLDNRLTLDIRDGAGETASMTMSFTPLRRLIKDYFLICDSYYAAIRTATPAQIEALDISRGAHHDEGARTLMERVAGFATLDFPTARGLFTLICALVRHA